MTDESSTPDSRDESTVDANDLTATAVSSTYKVLGELSASDGAGVQGKNTASVQSGSGNIPIGVEGAVPNATGTGYGLSTPHDARVGGILETPTANVDTLSHNGSGTVSLTSPLDANSNNISSVGELTATTASVGTLDNDGSDISLGDTLDTNGNALTDSGAVSVSGDLDVSGSVSADKGPAGKSGPRYFVRRTSTSPPRAGNRYHSRPRRRTNATSSTQTAERSRSRTMARTTSTVRSILAPFQRETISTSNSGLGSIVER
jgi:hypothetical protein